MKAATGPLSVLQATLGMFGWCAFSLEVWRTPAGLLVEVDPSGDCAALTGMIIGDVQKKLWSAAAGSHLGKALDNGVAAVSLEFEVSLKKKDNILAGVLGCILTGGGGGGSQLVYHSSPTCCPPVLGVVRRTQMRGTCSGNVLTTQLLVWDVLRS